MFVKHGKVDGERYEEAFSSLVQYSHSRVGEQALLSFPGRIVVSEFHSASQVLKLLVADMKGVSNEQR